MDQVKILAFAGSTRRESFNKKLLTNAINFAEEHGASVTRIDLRDLPMPFYDGDLEHESGIPENGRKFMDLLISHDGFMIASPEYNSSFTAVLKNAIDWASRPAEGVKTLEAFDGKVSLIMSASPGSLGGLRGLYSLRTMLGNLKTLVTPGQLAVSMAREAFDENDILVNERYRKQLDEMVKKFLHLTACLKNV